MFWLLVGCLVAPGEYRAFLAHAEDADRDGHRSVAWGGDDCDDDDPEVFPAALEICDGVDNDCDGLVDNDPADPSEWYLDGDQDGYGNLERVSAACEAPPGHVGQAGDCDDGDAEIHPQGYEVCDGVDNDCDGLVDDADDSLDLRTGELWYPDNDGDGYGEQAEGVQSCAGPEGYIDAPGDCDDSDAAVNPNAAEVCRDGVDNDCSGDAPECALRGEVSWGDADFALNLGEYMVATTMDSNGDGVQELVVGHPERTYKGKEDAGTVYLLEQPYSDLLTDATWTTSGSEAGHYLGTSVSGGVDINDDGLEDLAVGVMGDHAVHVFLGRESGLSSSADFLIDGPDLAASYPMAFVQLLPGGQLATVSPSSRSVGNTQVHLWHDAPTRYTEAFQADWSLTVQEGSELYLSGSEAWGDLNGDGALDFVLPNYEREEGYLFIGPLEGDQTGSDRDTLYADTMGSATFADIDADGYQDLIIGDPVYSANDSWNGAAHIFLGGSGPVATSLDQSDADFHIYGDESTDRLGLVYSGDLDSDGNADLILANGDAEAFAFYGPLTDGLTLDNAAAHLSASDTHVCSYSTLSDVDDDGSSDIILNCVEGDYASLRILYGTAW
ncbi:MAG: MopE-related protein [Myxococcota bacterium]|nr:MopE-related protein [Myxococcota bacterium]